jgi:hypothetical protein
MTKNFNNTANIFFLKLGVLSEEALCPFGKVIPLGVVKRYNHKELKGFHKEHKEKKLSAFSKYAVTIS